MCVCVTRMVSTSAWRHFVMSVETFLCDHREHTVHRTVQKAGVFSFVTSLHAWSFGHLVVSWSTYLRFSLLKRHTCSLQEEFCYPVECLALTVEEVMHIRQVLVKAELEKFQQYKDVYTALKKGKVEATWGVLSCQSDGFPQSLLNGTNSIYLPYLILYFPSQLCFSCRTKRFSLFTWSYTCQFCKR